MSSGHIQGPMSYNQPSIALNSVSIAVIGELHRRQWPVVTDYELFRLLWDVYEHPEKYPNKIRKRAVVPRRKQFEHLIFELSLVEERFIRSDPDFEPHSKPSLDTRVFRITETPDASAEDILCLVDPFAAVAYLSAMQRHGLTTRQPKAAAFVTFEEQTWRRRRNDKVREDYGFDIAEAKLRYFVNLLPPKSPPTLRGRPLDVHRVKQMPRTQAVADGFARIVEIGDLFVQMLTDPELCGGMRHVLETWEEHAETYLDFIIDAVSNSSSPIAHVRAGYILAERMEISDPRVELWKKYAQRGGSRRLDPSAPYEPIFSESWMISLNV